jgi:D-alanyl-lipoteichoic acid acyltransferase DltB (MBOAT superfamily)
MSENAQRWLFIAFGFLGAILTITISFIDFYKVRKTRSIKTTLLIQCVVLLINLTMFIYGFGLSMINIHRAILYNSMPT